MLEDDRSYFRRRAEAELEQARHGRHPKAVAAHRQIAAAYLERVSPAVDGADARRAS